MASEAQIAANRVNSQLSNGPSSAEGKSISSHNAEDTGIYKEKFSILAHENITEFHGYLNASIKYWRPADQLQLDHVHEIVQLQWELWRYRAAEPEIIKRYAVKNNISHYDAWLDMLSDSKTNPLKYLLRLRSKTQDRWAARVKDLQRLQKSAGGASGSGDLVAGVPQGTASPSEIGFVPKSTGSSPEIAPVIPSVAADIIP